MCCFSTLFLVIGSRLAILVWWLAQPQRFNLAFSGWIPGGFAIPAWAWTLLGAIAVPWTTLAYVLVAPGGVVGYEWIVIVVGLLIDLTGHGGSYHHRHHVRRFYRRRS